jgi:ATP-dependent DNA helicase RecG
MNINIQESQNIEFKQIFKDEYLKAYISYEGMHRREKLEYPYEVLREAVINALIHRDYTNTSNLQIKVYDDKLVMYNGATLSEEVPIEKFDKVHQSKPFNPTIANIFYKCGFIENWDKGTINIIEDCMAYGLPKTTFEYEWTAVRVTFYKAITNDELNGTINGTINNIYNYILNNPNQSAVFISETFNIPLRTLKRKLKQLIEEDKIQYKGSKKTGGYYVT